MAKQFTSIVAGIKAASKGNPAFVLASSKENLPTSDSRLDVMLAGTKFDQFDCVACGTSMHAVAGTEPFCVTCGAGDGHVHATKEAVRTKVSSKNDLVSLECTVCSHVTSMEAGFVRAITAGKENPVFCSSCGNSMYLAAELLDEADPASDPDTLNDGSAGEVDLSVEATSDDPEMDLDVDGDIDDDDLKLDSLSEVESGVDAEECKSGATPLAEMFDEADLELEAFSIEEEPSGEVLDPAEEDLSVTEDAEDLSVEGELNFDEEQGDPLVDALEMDDTEVLLSFVRAGNRVVAMKGHIAIASLSKRSQGSGAKIINSSALPIAAMSAVQTNGLRKGLASLGFSLIRVPVSTTATVARKVEEVKASARAKEEAFRRDFSSVFALAAAGLNRGNWKGFDNPLRSAMEGELSRAGVENPRRVVASVFENAGIPYAKTLLEVSNKLSKMSAAARNELSEMLNMTQILASEDPEDFDPELEDEEAPVPTTVESRFSRPALFRPIEKPSALTASASDVLNGKADLTFSF